MIPLQKGASAEKLIRDRIFGREQKYCIILQFFSVAAADSPNTGNGYFDGIQNRRGNVYEFVIDSGNQAGIPRYPAEKR